MTGGIGSIRSRIVGAAHRPPHGGWSVHDTDFGQGACDGRHSFSQALVDLRNRGVHLHDTTSDFDPSFPTWRSWLLAHGMADIEHTRGLRMNSSVLAIQAAIDAQGVALARSVIVERDLDAGRLVKPFEFARLAPRASESVGPLERTPS